MSKYLTIPQAAEYLKIDSHYMRKLVREKKVISKHVFIGNSTKNWRHEISTDELDKRKTIKRSQRSDNRTKYTIYLTSSEKTKHDKIYKENKLTNLIVRSNPPKSSK